MIQCCSIGKSDIIPVCLPLMQRYDAYLTPCVAFNKRFISNSYTTCTVIFLWLYLTTQCYMSDPQSAECNSFASVLQRGDAVSGTRPWGIHVFIQKAFINTHFLSWRQSNIRWLLQVIVNHRKLRGVRGDVKNQHQALVTEVEHLFCTC